MSIVSSEVKKALIESLIRPEIKALNSYHVPDSSGLLKLDAMENPNPWPGGLTQEWLDTIKQVEANRYPDPAGMKVKAGLREMMSLDTIEAKYSCALDILLGNGSDEIIQMIALAVANSERPIMAPEPSFVMYGMIAKFVGMPYVGIDLDTEFQLDTQAFLKAIALHNPAVIFLALPNNPTGNLFAIDDVRIIIEASKGLVVIDEAYIAFTDSDLLSLAAEYANVVVMRTLSKVGLAGLRLGFLVGHSAWLTEFDKVRLPYNINVLTQASVEFALEHYAVFEQQTRQLQVERKALFDRLSKIQGVSPVESEANFILVRCDTVSAKLVFSGMKARGVLIKCLDGAHPLLANCLRLTVGSAEENEAMLVALSFVLSSIKSAASSSSIEPLT